MRQTRLRHRFVERVPRELEPGVLYVSIEHGTAIHSCCCGCGEEVVTPLTPTDWRMTYDGESVSLHPSIGNWQLKCRSHYIIDRGRIVEAGRWTPKRIADEHERDRRAKAWHYAAANAAAPRDSSPTSAPEVETVKRSGFWTWLKALLG